MRRTLIVLSVFLAGRGAFAQTGPKIKINPDGSQVYQYQNGAVCIKQADYATERTISGKASITKVFSAEASSSQKVVDALAYSPSVSAIHAALFDMCTAYGSGTIIKEQYDEERGALAKLQIAVIEKEALSTPQKTGASQETDSKEPKPSDTKSGPETPKDGPASKSSPPSGAVTKTDQAKPPETDSKEPNSSGAKSGSGTPKDGPASKSSSPSVTDKKTDQAKPQPTEVNTKDQPASSTQPAGTASAKNEVPATKAVQPPNPGATSTDSPPQPFPVDRTISFKVKVVCHGYSRDGLPFDYEQTLPASLSFMADSKFDSITETCYGQASTASGNWKRIGSSIAVTATVGNQKTSLFCTVATGDKLSCSNLVSLFPNE